MTKITTFQLSTCTVSLCQTLLVLVNLLLLLSISISNAQLDNKCGECWCINDPNGNGTECPSSSVAGYQQGFVLGLSDWYLSLKDTNPLSLLVDGNDNDNNQIQCFPFQGIMEPQQSYPESYGPQCAITDQTSINEGYCAFIFEDSESLCVNSSNTNNMNKNYEVMTFPTEEAAWKKGGFITHKGGCGVCSSAQDFGARINHLYDIAQLSLLCGTQYFLTGRDFGKLVQCFEDIGFTVACSKLWSHFTAANAALCAAPCFGHEPPYNGAPPECAVTECLQCAEDFFQKRFDQLSGRTLPGSGIVDPFLASPCSLYYPVAHQAICASLTGGTMEGGDFATDIDIFGGVAGTSTTLNGGGIDEEEIQQTDTASSSSSSSWRWRWTNSGIIRLSALLLSSLLLASLERRFL